ncbi:MAG: hypothetical protein KF678_05110 [Phycisphaeraceae bacterium]|nr:hypothetical protein [Phycisphaeraceae bacterium]
MRKAIVRVVCAGVALCLGACVATSDPDATSRLSLETRAQQTGRAEPARPSTRLFGRRSVAETPVPDRFAERQPAAAPSVVVPQTASGKQLEYLCAVLSGGTTRRLDSAFAESFFRRTSESNLRAALEQWRRDEFADGPAEVQAVEDSTLSTITAVLHGKTSGRYSRLRLSTDRFGKISSLSLTAVQNYRPGDLAEWSLIDQRLSELGPGTSLAASEVGDDGPRPVHVFRADAPRAIGGLSSLYIAGAITELVKAGSLRWDEALPIDDQLKSLMGGRMQLEPEETEFPLVQYMTLLLGGGGWNGWGDTTAFDHLFARAGRNTIHAYLERFNSVPERNRPFLASMEYFRIKLGHDRSLPARYAAADEQGRASLLQLEGLVDRSLPSLSAAANWRLPFEVERIGYFATADDVSRMLADLLATSQQPGMSPLARALRMTDALDDVGSGRWTSAGIKAGSEPGILSMAWVLERHDGRVFTLVLLANDPSRPLRHTELTEVAAAAVRLLSHDGPRR